MQLIYRGFCYNVAESTQSIHAQQVTSSPVTLLYRGNRYQIKTGASDRNQFLTQQRPQTSLERIAAGLQLIYRGATYTI